MDGRGTGGGDDMKSSERQEGSVGRGQSVGMDGIPNVRFRKTERKTMRMEQLIIKSGNRVRGKDVLERSKTKGDEEEP